MLIRKAADLTYVDVTPKQVYLNRRRFLEAMGIVGATAIAGRRLFELAAPSETALAASKFSGLLKSPLDRKSTRLNSSHGYISYAVFCLKKKKKQQNNTYVRRSIR